MPRHLSTALALALGAAAIAGCVNRKLEHLSATTTDGRLVAIDSVTSSFDAGGITVIHRHNAANRIVVVDIYLLGGVRELTPATQGIEKFALTASQYGTAHYPGAATRAAIGRTGSHVFINPQDDWTDYGFIGLADQFDSTWNVVADRLMNPTLAAKDVETTRARLIGNLRQRYNDPDGALFAIADTFAFAGHPYALSPSGTEQSLAAIDSAAAARFVAARMMRSRMLVVVVGNVDRPTVERAIARTFAQLPLGDYRWTLPERAKLTGNRALLVHRPMQTNYLLGMYQGPPASANDYQSFRVAVEFLSGQVHDAVREKRGLSYSAGAPYVDRGIEAGGLYVSTNRPVEALEEMRRQVQQMREFPEDFPMFVFTRSFVMDYISKNSTSADQAEALARAHLYRGDYKVAMHEMDDMRRVSAISVGSAARRYFNNMQFVYLGDTTRAGPELRKAMVRVSTP
jgi:zinc protease